MTKEKKTGGEEPKRKKERSTDYVQLFKIALYAQALNVHTEPEKKSKHIK